MRLANLDAVTAFGPAWWQTLLIAFAGGGLALVGTIAVGWFSRQSRRHTEWFRRVQWAEGLIPTDDETAKTSGYQVLAYLAHSTLASRDDRQLVQQLAYDLDLVHTSASDQPEVDSTEYMLDDEEPSTEEDGGV